MKLRIVVIAEIALVLASLVAHVQMSQEKTEAAGLSVMDAIAMPGTELRAMSCGQACWVAGRVERLMRARSRGTAGREEFVAAVSMLRESGAAGSQPLCSGGRTLSEVARELGRLMREQRCGCAGPNQHVAATLKRLSQARAAGVPEQEVQRMAREAVARGELTPGRPGTGQQLRKQMDALVQEMVEAVHTPELSDL